MHTRLRHTRAASAVLVVAIALALSLDVPGPGRHVDAWLWDHLSALAAPGISDDDTVVFGLDDASMADLQPLIGSWPYRRDVWAHVVDYLRARGARHVTLDVLFADPRDGDDQLRAALARTPDIVLAAVPVPFRMTTDASASSGATDGMSVAEGTPAGEAIGMVAPRPELQAVARLGVATAGPDEDGVVRRLPVLTRVGRTWVPALAIASLFGSERNVTWRSDWRGPTLLIAGQALPVDRTGRIELRYPATVPAMATLPFSRLVRAAVTDVEDPELAAKVRGRRVFMGSTALLLEEAVPTPVGRVPGVEFVRLATVLLRDGATVRSRVAVIDAIGLTIALGVLWVGWAWRPDRTWTILVALVLACVASIALAMAMLVLLQQRTWLLGPLVAASTSAALLILADLVRLRRERGRIEAERHAAERASELKTQFLNHIAHELRTPVTAILGFGRLIVEGRDPRETREYARVIARNGAHLLQLVNNLLDDATIAVGRARIDLQPVAVRQVVSDVIATVEGLPRNDSVALSGDVAPEVPPYVLIDALRVRQILLNLLANAMKFTEVGGIELVVTWEGGRLTLSVQDSGSGIPSESLARMFDEYEQGSQRAGRMGGTGLGLSVSRRLARLMGGDLEASSAEGRGSRFTLTLPARQATPPHTSSSLHDADHRAVTPDGPLVLVCDDIEDIRQLFAVVLTGAGARVVTAGTGKEAVALAQALRPEAVLLDLDLPDQDGLVTASQLRVLGYEGPIIAISGSGEDREAALRDHGFSDSARKPVSSALLVDLVARHLRHWRPTRPPLREV